MAEDPTKQGADAQPQTAAAPGSGKPPDNPQGRPAASASAPAPALSDTPDAELFIERYDAVGWKERYRQVGAANRHAVAGALHDVASGVLLTENEVRSRVEAYNDREHVYEVRP